MKKIKDIFIGKTLLIVGGTGSFGHAVLKKFINSSFKEIRIFSRDEKKQYDMRNLFRSSKLKFYIGDVRDYQSILAAMRGVDYVFHAAALKQVPSCEFHPLEAVKTNILGTENVLEASIICGVERVICLSTDKAVYPINAMGISKAMMEKIVIAKCRDNIGKTIINITRYGNVMASRGSVIPLFIDQIKKNRPITITNPKMTRFMMTLDQAVDLVLYAFVHGKNGDIFVQKSPACNIDTLVKAILSLFKKKNHIVEVIGTRHGEKLYEDLCSQEEMLTAKDEGNYYRISLDKRDQNYDKFFNQGSKDLQSIQSYNSHNTKQLDENEMENLLLNIDYIKKIVIGDKAYPDE